MIRSKSARTLLSISLVAVTSALAAPVRQTVLPKLECGVYRASGQVRQNAAGQYLLTLNFPSDSFFELILLGGDFDARYDRVGRRTVAELYVPKPIKDGEAPHVFLQKLGGLPSTPDDGVELLKKHRCGDDKKYVALH